MPHRTFGYLHAQALHARHALASPRGQGTVEYVALLLLVAGILTVVVAAGRKGTGFGIAEAVGGKLKEMITTVGKDKP